MVSLLSIIILPIVLGLLAGLIVLVVKGGTAGRIIAGVICGGIFLVLFFGFFISVPVVRSVDRVEQVQLLEETQQRVDEIRRRGEDIRLRGEEMRNGVVRIGSSNRMNVETTFSEGVPTSVSHGEFKSRVSLVTLPLLVIGGGLLVGLIVLVVKGGTAGKVIGGVILSGILLLALIAGLKLVSVRESHTLEQAQRNAIAVLQPANDDDMVWREGVEQGLKADVYLSKSAAIVGLAREIKLERIAVDVLEREDKPGHIRILEGGVETHLLGELKQILSGAFPDMISIVAADTTVAEQDVTISLAYAELGQTRVTVNELDQVDIVKMQHDVGPAMTSGRLEAAVQTAKGKDVYSVKFAEKTWLTDTTEFVAANPNQNWQVVRSSDACISEQQAMAQAIEKACEMLKMNVGMTNAPVTEQYLIEGGFISDRFTQSFYGSAGKIWRAAVLVDVSPERLRILAGRKTVMVKHYRSELLNQILTLAGVISLICLVYFFLNAATKGYYSWAMRFAAVVLILAGIFIVLMLS